MDSYERTLREKLVSLSDTELSSVIRDIGNAVGANEHRVNGLTADIDRLRTLLSSMTDEQARRLLAGIDPKTAQEAIDKLEKRY